MQSDLEAACRVTGLIDPAAAEWMAPIVQNGERAGLGYDLIAVQVRQFGTPLTAEQKRSIGVRANAKLSVGYLGSLTDKGRAIPLDAAFLVVQRVLHARSCSENLRQLRRMADSLKGVEILPVEDDQTCAAARRVAEKVFPVSIVPALPLSECNAEYCRCVYSGVPKNF